MNKKNKKISPTLLIIAGGAFKGFGYLGSLQALYNNSIDIYNIKKLSGSSIGSIICTALTLGYSINECKNKLELIRENINEIFPCFKSENKEKILPNLINNYCLSDGKYLEKILEDLFTEKKFNPKTLTFCELKKITKKTLYITTSNITSGKPEIFSSKKTPYMSVYKALLMSCRIPLLLPPINYQGSMYLDGDLLNPFPINCLSKLKLKKETILGIAHNSLGQSYVPESFLDFYPRIISCVIQRYFHLASNKYKNNVIILPFNAKTSIITSKNEAENMYNVGYKEAILFINKKNTSNST